MVDSISGVNQCCPAPRRSPHEIMRDRARIQQQIRMEKLYEYLQTKAKNGQKLTDVEQMQLYCLKALKIADTLGKPQVMY